MSRQDGHSGWWHDGINDLVFVHPDYGPNTQRERNRIRVNYAKKWNGCPKS